MTFDDGIIKICQTVQVAENTIKPKLQLSERERFYFGYDVLGINRYYTALRANVQIDAVVNIPGWHEIDSRDIGVLEDGRQFRLAMIQPQLNEDGLRITKLSLSRITENYAMYTPPAPPAEVNENDNANETDDDS